MLKSQQMIMIMVGTPQERAARARAALKASGVLTKPTDDTAVNHVVKYVDKEHDYLKAMASTALDMGRDGYAGNIAIAMDRTWLAVQFLVAQTNREVLRCADCHGAIQNCTEATVRWFGDEAREEREIIHQSPDVCDIVRELKEAAVA